MKKTSKTKRRRSAAAQPPPKLYSIKEMPRVDVHVHLHSIGGEGVIEGPDAGCLGRLPLAADVHPRGRVVLCCAPRGYPRH